MDTNTPPKTAADQAGTDALILTNEADPRMVRGEMLIKDHMLASLGLGLLPFPLLDIATGLASNLFLVQRLCKLYDVKFSVNAARAAVLGIMGSVSSVGVAVTVGFSLGKFIPGIGTAVGSAALPVANAATTFVIGKMFLGHLELGGILVDFDPRSNKAYIDDAYGRGKELAGDMVSMGRRASVKTADGATAATAAATQA